MTSIKRLQNDISAQEDVSDRRVPANSYYIIWIVCDTAKDGAMVSLVKKLLYSGERLPLCSYIYGSSIYLLFSSVEQGEHYLSGNHHALCSKFTSLAVLHLGCEVSTRIIEIETRTKVLIYFYTKIQESIKQTIAAKSKGKLDKKELTQLTFAELKKALNDKCSISWDDDLGGEEKYGIFYKYISKPKPKYSTMSEMINLSQQDRYLSYMFE
jgi:hypothetical protein